jgi:hypothetical protein
VWEEGVERSVEGGRKSSFGYTYLVYIGVWKLSGSSSWLNEEDRVRSAILRWEKASMSV